ncbi:MAG: hypothetical protein ACYTGL_05050 [Planctomycetota bacterium]|jgi:hypothetical protein
MLDREEYVEQAYFWRTFLERVQDGVPAQEVIEQVREEILSTTKLPMALEFLLGEIRHKGRLSDGMAMMPHYFAPFQTLLMNKAEDETIKFDMLIALQILQAEAKYRASENLTRPGLFIYQFECIARNRLGYHEGMEAIANDSQFNKVWADWILWVRRQLGTTEFCEFLYRRSEFAVEEKRRSLNDSAWKPDIEALFGLREGRIAKANRGKDPLYMFAALQRQLGYPEVPKAKPQDTDKIIHPLIEQRFQLLEKRLSIVEQEQKEGIDLSEFYAGPGQPPPNPPTK